MTDTVRTIPYLLNNEFQNGQAAGSITPQYVRDLIVTMQSLTVPEIAATQQAGAYVFALTDAESVVESTSTAPVIFTIPPSSSVAFNVGAVIGVFQYGAGQISLTAGAGVTLRTSSSLTTRAQYSTVSLRQRATNEWVLDGDLT